MSGSWDAHIIMARRLQVVGAGQPLKMPDVSIPALAGDREVKVRFIEHADSTDAILHDLPDCP